jgi:hypothetical protein
MGELSCCSIEQLYIVHAVFWRIVCGCGVCDRAHTLCKLVVAMNIATFLYGPLCVGWRPHVV